MNDQEIQRLADLAEKGYDPSQLKPRGICLICKTLIRRIPGGWECAFCEIPTTTYEGAVILEQRARALRGTGGLTAKPLGSVEVAPPRKPHTPTTREAYL